MLQIVGDPVVGNRLLVAGDLQHVQELTGGKGASASVLAAWHGRPPPSEASPARAGGLRLTHCVGRRVAAACGPLFRHLCQPLDIMPPAYPLPPLRQPLVITIPCPCQLTLAFHNAPAHAGGQQLLAKFQWWRQPKTQAQATWVAVQGATKPSYTLTMEDSGCWVKATATPQLKGATAAGTRCAR